MVSRSSFPRRRFRANRPLECQLLHGFGRTNVSIFRLSLLFNCRDRLNSSLGQLPEAPLDHRITGDQRLLAQPPDQLCRAIEIIQDSTESS